MQRRAETGADDADPNRLPWIGLKYGSGNRLGVAHTTSRSWRDRGTARRWVGLGACRGMDATTSDGAAPTCNGLDSLAYYRRATWIAGDFLQPVAPRWRAAGDAGVALTTALYFCVPERVDHPCGWLEAYCEFLHRAWRRWD